MKQQQAYIPKLTEPFPYEIQSIRGFLLPDEWHLAAIEGRTPFVQLIGKGEAMHKGYFFRNSDRRRGGLVALHAEVDGSDIVIDPFTRVEPGAKIIGTGIHLEKTVVEKVHV